MRPRSILLSATALLGFAVEGTAHSPHDHIEAFELGRVSGGSGTVMLIVVRGNLWRSMDEGASWKRIVRGLDNRKALARLAVSDGSDGGSTWFLATDGGGLFRSEDDGWSWERAPEDAVIPGADEAMDFASVGSGLTDERITSTVKIDDNRLFVSTWSEGVFFSEDGGETWERRAAGLTTDPQGDRRGLPQFTTLRRLTKGTLFLAGYDGLFRSDDEGRNWIEIETLPETLLIDFDLSPNHREDGELVATTYWKGAFHSGDRGENWRPINGNLAPSYWDHLKRRLKGDDEFAQIVRFHSIAFSPDYAEDRTLFAGLRNWFLITASTGRRWERIELTQFANGEDVIPDRIVFSNAFASDGTLFFCARLGEGKTRRGGVFKSIDRGRTFALVHEEEGKYMQSLAISPRFSENGMILVSSARGGNNSEVFRSIDGGETWEVVTGDLKFVDFGAELAFTDSERVVAGTERGLWSGAGRKWFRLSEVKRPSDVIATGPERTGFVDTLAAWPRESRADPDEPSMPLVAVFKGEGAEIFEGEFKRFHPELFEQNHQFNRLWSYSPGAMIKFVKGEKSEWDGEFFGMTGEALFRIEKDTAEELPLRAVAAQQGQVNLGGFWGGVAVFAATLIFGAWWLTRRRKT